MKNVAWNLFEILINIYQGIVAMYFSFKYLSGKYSDKFIKNFGLPFSLLLALTISICNHITFFEHIYAAFYGALIFAYSVFCLKGNVYNKLFVSIYSLIVLLLSGVAVAWLTSTLFNIPIEQILIENSVIRLLGIILTQFLIFYFYYFSIKIFKHDMKGESCLTGTEAVLISITLILSIVIVLILYLVEFEQSNKRNRQLFTVILICVILINIVTLYITADLKNKNNSEIENEKLKLQSHFNAAVYDAISIAISDKIMEDETFTITTQMKQRLKQLFFNDDFIDSINGSTNDKSKILKRIKIVKGVLK